MTRFNSILQIFQPLVNKLDQSEFYKGVMWLASGTALAQIIGVLSTFAISRLYIPSDYAVLAMLTAILAPIQPLSTLTYSMAIPLAKDKNLAHAVLGLCFSITVSMSIILALLVVVFGKSIALRYSFLQYASYLWLLPLCFLGAGLYETLNFWAIRERAYRLIAKTKLSQSITSAVIKIGLGCLSIRPLGLVLGLLASQIAGIFPLARELSIRNSDSSALPTWNELRFAAKRFARFPLFRSWSRVLVGFNNKMPVLLIGPLYGLDTLGLFAFANLIIKMPIGLISTSVAQVYYAEIAKFGKNRPDKIRDLSWSIMRKMVLIGIVPMGVILIGGPWLFSFAFGDNWEDAGTYARYLSVVTFIQFVVGPVVRSYDVLEMQKSLLALNILLLTMITGVFFIAHVLEMSATSAVVAYCITLTLYTIVGVSIVLIMLTKRANGISRNK